jgi:hypothetical protein
MTEATGEKDEDRLAAEVRDLLSRFVQEYQSDLRLMQGTVAALAAAVTGLAAASPNPERVRIEIQRTFRESCARSLGEMDNDVATKGARVALDLVGQALGGVIL